MNDSSKEKIKCETHGINADWMKLTHSKKAVCLDCVVELYLKHGYKLYEFTKEERKEDFNLTEEKDDD